MTARARASRSVPGWGAIAPSSTNVASPCTNDQAARAGTRSAVPNVACALRGACREQLVEQARPLAESTSGLHVPCAEGLRGDTTVLNLGSQNRNYVSL